MSGHGGDGRSMSGRSTSGRGTSASSSRTSAPSPSSGNSTFPAATTTCREAYRTGRARANASRRAARVPAGDSNATGSLPVVSSSAGFGWVRAQRAACPSSSPAASNTTATDDSPYGSSAFSSTPSTAAASAPSTYRRANRSQPARPVSTSSR
ncbi:hypothetical protein [Actinomadura geliboluensis]